MPAHRRSGPGAVADAGDPIVLAGERQTDGQRGKQRRGGKGEPQGGPTNADKDRRGLSLEIFELVLYLQNVLGASAIDSGLELLPLTLAIFVTAVGVVEPARAGG